MELPHSIELERCVLGTIIVDPNALVYAMGSISKEVFYDKAHQIIFGVIEKLFNDSQAVDLLTVVDWLSKDGTLEKVGGASYVSEIASTVFSSAHLDTHIAILEEKCYQRRVIMCATELIERAYNYNHDALVDCINDFPMTVNSVIKHLGVEPSLGNIIDGFISSIDVTNHVPNTRISSGFEALDKLIMGFQSGSLNILASRPGMGKTICALSMARNIAIDYGIPVAFYSFSMKGNDLMLRLISQETRIPLRELCDIKSLSAAQRRSMADKMGELRGAPLYIDDSDLTEINRFETNCRLSCKRYNIRMIFIDYIQLMASSDRSNTIQGRDGEIGDIVRRLKRLAVEIDVPIMALSGVSRGVEQRGGMHVPMLQDLRESGTIEEVADIVLALHRCSYYGADMSPEGRDMKNIASLYVLKNNSGEINDKIELNYEGECCLFSNL